MENNSKLTEKYKTEITNILEKISAGLSKSVIETLDPKIMEVTSSLVKNSNVVSKFNRNNKVIFNDIFAKTALLEEMFININKQNYSFAKTTNSNFKNSTNKLAEIIQLNNDIHENIENSKKTINNSINNSNDILVNNNKSQVENLLFELKKISNSITKLENQKTIEFQFVEIMNNQKRNSVLIYILISIIIIVLAMTISLWLKF